MNKKPHKIVRLGESVKSLDWENVKPYKTGRSQSKYRKSNASLSFRLKRPRFVILFKDDDSEFQDLIAV